MLLKKLCLKNYRNYDYEELEFNSGKNLIIGKNAQGKTNVLESVYVLSTLKSPRTSNNTELIKFNSEETELSAIIHKNNTDIDLSFKYGFEKKKELKINNLKTSSSNFKNIVKTVLFSTNDLLLLRGVPQDRRDWIDRAISQIYPLYDEKLSKYDKIRIQKNNLLKQDKLNENLLDVYNEQMSITGSNIVFLRQKFLKEIENIAKKNHHKIAENEKLDIKYTSTFKTADSIEKTAENFKKELEENKKIEILKRQSVIGPHRDDIIFFINNKESTKFASQGQQRTIVLSLKIAELEMIKNKTGETPVLLLDDVLAELDDLRQNYLLNSIEKDTQTIITSVDTILFNDEFLKDVKIFTVDNGRIINTL